MSRATPEALLTAHAAITTVRVPMEDRSEMNTMVGLPIKATQAMASMIMTMRQAEQHRPVPGRQRQIKGGKTMSARIREKPRGSGNWYIVVVHHGVR